MLKTYKVNPLIFIKIHDITFILRKYFHKFPFWKFKFLIYAIDCTYIIIGQTFLIFLEIFYHTIDCQSLNFQNFQCYTWYNRLHPFLQSIVILIFSENYFIKCISSWFLVYSFSQQISHLLKNHQELFFIQKSVNGTIKGDVFYLNNSP